MKKLSELEYVSMKGEGYFCTIKLYRDPEDQALYALKELKRKHLSNVDYKVRFQKEIRIIRALQGCGHIIDLIDYNDSTEDDGMYMLMPFADHNLSSFIVSTNSNPDIELRYEIFEQIIFAIKFAHNRNILHRDLAPNNILLLWEYGELMVKVSDFGLGKDLSKDSHFTKTSSSQYGQIYYCAPEQAADLRNASVRSDIYSLACVCYYIFTGKIPHNRKSFDFTTLVDKATSEDPNLRHSNMEEFEEHFLKLKSIALVKSDSNRYVSLKEFLMNNGPIDNTELHERLIEKREYSNITLDFLMPITQYFLKKNNLHDYYQSVGNNFHSFMVRYYTLFHHSKNSKWDFKNMDDYGQLLVMVINLVNISQSRLLCFKFLLEMAYYGNRFSVQNKLKSVFIERLIPQDIEVQLAEFIESNSFSLKDEHFNLDEIPVTIRLIILEKIRIKKQEEEEYRKRVENMNIDI